MRVNQKQNLLIALMLMLFITVNVTAQQNDIPFGDLPPTNEFGKCYAKCKIPDVYETISLQKVIKEASTKLEKVAAVYETATETIQIKEASTRYKTIPATFKTITERVMVMPEKRTLRTIAAKYTTESKQVLVSPARGQWVRKKKSPGCFSQNPNDCYVACYEEIPAVYRTERTRVMAEGPKTVEDVIPAKYKTISKKVIDQPARVEEIPVEAKFKTVSKKVLVSPEATREITIPAEYKTVKERRLIKQGGYTVWTEILCAERTTSSKILSVQRSLSEKGYNPGTIDGVMGIKTQTALKQFQTDKGLPVGNLNLETLKALGVKS